MFRLPMFCLVWVFISHCHYFGGTMLTCPLHCIFCVFSWLLTGLWTGRDARATGCVEEGLHGTCSVGFAWSPVAPSLGPAVTPLSPLSEDSLSDKKPAQTHTNRHTRARFNHWWRGRVRAKSGCLVKDLFLVSHRWQRVWAWDSCRVRAPGFVPGQCTSQHPPLRHPGSPGNAHPCGIGSIALLPPCRP